MGKQANDQLPWLTIRVHDDLLHDGVTAGQRVEVLRDGEPIGQLASVSRVTHTVDALRIGKITVELDGRGDMETYK